MVLQPWYIVPLLVEQPTWGGEYIVGFKQINEPTVTHTKIGQAFELAVESMVTTHAPQSPAFLTAEATSLNQSALHGDADTISLQSLIDEDAEGVLGESVLPKTGPQITLLIKFTQAQNNSYQLHIPIGETRNHWIPKPESWYYFERGKATMGLAPDVDIDEYQKRCQEIYQYSQDVSEQIAQESLTVAQAREQLRDFIQQDHPQRFVNTIFVEKDEILDLSEGGIHHSWETDPNIPNGNIVYEVQLDAKDDLCTIRSFDQGSIKDTGAVRPLAIEDYFAVLNTDPEFNRPERFKRTGKTYQDNSATITTLFDNQFYRTKKIVLDGAYQGKETQTDGSYHHLFVKSGSISVTTESGDYPLSQGWSLFIPAGLRSYGLSPSSTAEILKTTVA